MSTVEQRLRSEREGERGPGASPQGSGGWPVTLQGMAVLFLEWRRLFVVLPLATAVLAGLWALTRPKSYTSSAAFVPRTTSESPLARFSGLAAQLGVAVPLGDAGQSPDFYASLLKSRQLLRSTVESPYRAERDGAVQEGDLVRLLDARGARPEDRREAAIRLLSARAKVTRELKTGIVRLEVRMPSASLAQQVANRMLELLDHYNREVLRSQASAERTFVEGRLADARQELSASEDRLLAFLQKNRDYRNSPELSFTADRLERDVALRQQVVTSLAQSYEQARIDVVRNTPVITVVERPEAPVRRNARGTVLAALLGGVAGCAVALFLVLGSQALLHERAEDGIESARLSRLWHDARRELLRPWQLLRRTSQPSDPDR